MLGYSKDAPTQHDVPSGKGENTPGLDFRSDYFKPIEKEAEEKHFNAIKSAHPDFATLRDSGAVKEWIKTLPDHKRAAYTAVYNQGTATEVINLFTDYKKANAMPAKRATNYTSRTSTSITTPERYEKDEKAIEELNKIPDRHKVETPNPAPEPAPVDFAVDYYNQGLAFNDSKKFEKAIVAFNKAISIKPDYAEAYDGLGFSFYHQRFARKDKAIEAFKQAIRIKPDFVTAHFNLGVAYSDPSINDRGSALEEYKILKKLNPKEADELLYRINN